MHVQERRPHVAQRHDVAGNHCNVHIIENFALVDGRLVRAEYLELLGQSDYQLPNQLYVQMTGASYVELEPHLLELVKIIRLDTR